MKLFLFTDTHGDKKIISSLIKKIKSSQPDLVLCAGDLTNFSFKLKENLTKFNKLKIPMLIIPGNHESNSDLNKLTKNMKYIKNLHKKSYQFSNFVFFGYGSGGFEKRSKELEKIIPNFQKTLSKDSKVILLTHQPPYKTKLDFMKNMGHQGNKSIRKFIKKIKPKLAICGHLHENENKKDRLSSTILINPGTKSKVIEL